MVIGILAYYILKKIKIIVLCTDTLDQGLILHILHNQVEHKVLYVFCFEIMFQKYHLSFFFSHLLPSLPCIWSINFSFETTPSCKKIIYIYMITTRISVQAAMCVQCNFHGSQLRNVPTAKAILLLTWNWAIFAAYWKWSIACQERKDEVKRGNA